MKNLRNWSVVKLNVHDLSGIENPENWLWERVDGVFYPVEEVKTVEVVEETEEEKQRFENLDPDMSDEEIESLGYEIKCSKLFGEEVVDLRDGCGHLVVGLN